MSEVLTPILVGAVMLLIPVVAGMATRAMAKKLDEGRNLAEERAAKTEKLLLEYQGESERIAAARHQDNVKRFDTIEMQTTQTNGKLADHDKQITTLAAQQELLIRLFPGPQQPTR